MPVPRYVPSNESMAMARVIRYLWRCETCQKFGRFQCREWRDKIDQIDAIFDAHPKPEHKLVLRQAKTTEYYLWGET